MLKLSIVTINLNNAIGLRKTIESVVFQTFNDFEYIIIDGGSIDGSLEVIKEFANKITCWVSEPDTGIYNAMNKGKLKSIGEYKLFLNSGDSLYNSEILESVFHHLTGEFDLVCGKAMHWRNNRLFVKEPLENLRMSKIYKQTLPHQACFIKTTLFTRIELYNEGNEIVSDWEFFVKCAKEGVSYLPINMVITIMEPPNISSRFSNLYSLHKKEREERKQKLFVNYIDDLEELYAYRNRRMKVRIQRICDYFSIKRMLHIFKDKII